MIQGSDDRVPPMNPQLALRVAIVGSLALAMFAIIFFRLWFLQVLSGADYLRQASVNVTRDVAIPAGRGEILDRTGTPVVESERVPSVLISPPDLPVPITLAEMVADRDQPPAKDVALYHRLARVLQVSERPTRCRIAGAKRPPNGTKGTYRMSPIACAVAQKVAVLPYDTAQIASNVPSAIQYYLGERQVQFPGVVVQPTYQRVYPYGNLAAQLFGTIGPMSCVDPKSKTNCEAHLRRFQGVPEQSIVGQSGVEWSYDQYLRGTVGKERIKVNSLGQFQGYGKEQAPITGHDLKLSIDLKLQEAGERALATSIGRNYGANGGAFVAMDPTNGQILAMGSNPTYDPSIFTHPISSSAYKQLTSASANFPLLNRATQTAGPTGSTFKVVTATAGLESGAWLAGETYTDTGQFCFGGGSTLCLHNAGHAVDGTLDITRALQVSSDDFFYNLGDKLNADPTQHPRGGALQDWARKFGIGRATGIDLPGESTGTLPTPRLFAELYKQELQCENATGLYKNKPKHPASAGGCGIANTPYWTVGDNVNMAVGQGNVQVTPMQLAVVYAALANGGEVVTPHVGLDVQSADGTVLSKIDPSAVRNIHINPSVLDTIRAGLRAAVAQPGGTSFDVMGNFPKEVYGKTGTAQYTNQTDYSWYACFVPPTATTKPIVVVVTVQRGGFGDVAAAPVARQILSQWFFHNPGPYKGGSSPTL